MIGSYNKYNKMMRGAIAESPRIQEAISKIKERGIPYDKIAEHCKVSKDTVKAWMQKNSLPIMPSTRQRLFNLAERLKNES